MFVKYKNPIYYKDERNNNIISLYKSGLSKVGLSEKFDISPQRIGQIVNHYRTLKNYNLRKEVFIYCQYKCVICHTKNKLQIHHIDNNSRNNFFDNLVVVCSKCHHSIHKIDRKSRIILKTKDSPKKRRPSKWDLYRQSEEYKIMSNFLKGSCL